MTKLDYKRWPFLHSRGLIRQSCAFVLEQRRSNAHICVDIQNPGGDLSGMSSQNQSPSQRIIGDKALFAEILAMRSNRQEIESTLDSNLITQIKRMAAWEIKAQGLVVDNPTVNASLLFNYIYEQIDAVKTKGDGKCDEMLFALITVMESLEDQTGFSKSAVHTLAREYRDIHLRPAGLAA